MFEQAFKNTDAFLDRQRDCMEAGGRATPGAFAEGRYKDQVEKYGALMGLNDSEPIKLGLYFLLLQGWREWEYKQQS